MATNDEGIATLLKVKKEHERYLGQIRHWEHLEIASDESDWWVRGITSDQTQSPAVRTLPFVELYTLKGNLLFPIGSLLPVSRLKADLSWHPIAQTLQVKRPKLNYNFFGIDESIEISLRPSNKEQATSALLLSTAALGNYAETSPAHRLKHLSWTLISEQQALVIGTPVLPLPGQTFWNCQSLYLPTGYELNFSLLVPALVKRLGLEVTQKLLLQVDAPSLVINEKSVLPLSISSVRLTLDRISSNLSAD